MCALPLGSIYSNCSHVGWLSGSLNTILRAQNLIHLCNQYQSPLTLWVPIPLRRGVFDTTLCESLSVTYRRSVVFSTSKTNHHDIADIILLKVALNTINQTIKLAQWFQRFLEKFTTMEELWPHTQATAKAWTSQKWSLV